MQVLQCKLRHPDLCALRRKESGPALLSSLSRWRIPHALLAGDEDGQSKYSYPDSDPQGTVSQEKSRHGESSQRSPSDARYQKHNSQVYQSNELDLKVRLRSLGLSGTLAYGFLNALHYGVGVVVAWIFICQVPRGVSLHDFARFLLRAIAIAWVSGFTISGSQVTKTFRVLAAVALAVPTNALIQYTADIWNASRRMVFQFYVASCFLFVITCVALLAACWVS